MRWFGANWYAFDREFTGYEVILAANDFLELKSSDFDSPTHLGEWQFKRKSTSSNSPRTSEVYRRTLSNMKHKSLWTPFSGQASNQYMIHRSPPEHPFQVEWNYERWREWVVSIFRELLTPYHVLFHRRYTIIKCDIEHQSRLLSLLAEWIYVIRRFDTDWIFLLLLITHSTPL